MITTCCDHMSEDGKFVFCDINRPFPEKCRTLCKAFVADQDPTPHRERVWAYHVTSPAQAQAEVAVIRSPGEVDAV